MRYELSIEDSIARYELSTEDNIVRYELSTEESIVRYVGPYGLSAEGNIGNSTLLPKIVSCCEMHEISQCSSTQLLLKQYNNKK